MFCLKENLVKPAVFSQGKLHCKENKNKTTRKIITPTTYTHTAGNYSINNKLTTILCMSVTTITIKKIDFCFFL